MRWVRTFAHEGGRVEVDPRDQVLGLDVPQDIETAWAEPAPARPFSPPPAARLSDIRQRGSFVSASMLAFKAKQFDDGLVAAVESTVQRGTTAVRGKGEMLAALLARAAADPAAAEDTMVAIVSAAAVSGGAPPPASLSDPIARTLEEFERDVWRSTPLGFYTWTPALRSLFRQDRLLQTPAVARDGARWLADALTAEPALRKTYEWCLTVAERLTGPSAGASLLPWITGSASPPESACFLPPSKSHETELVKRLYGTRPIPPDFNLADAMVDAIRSGAIDLDPHERSGWYDYQTWALEPLVAPERAPEAPRLRFTDNYRRQLVDLFKAVLALTRETHVKQLESPRAGMALPPPVQLRPALSVEPLAEYYRRRAQTYRFVRQLLEDVLGRSTLEVMRRPTPVGERPQSMARELAGMEKLFEGAYRTVCHETGTVPEEAAAAGADSAEYFNAWAATIADDPDIGQDGRMMVPIFYDVERRQTKIWAFLGWVGRPLRVWFAVRPRVRILDLKGRDVTSSVEVALKDEEHTLAYPVTAELYVDRPLDRDQFRRACGNGRTAEEILAAIRSSAA